MGMILFGFERACEPYPFRLIKKVEGLVRYCQRGPVVLKGKF